MSQQLNNTWEVITYDGGTSISIDDLAPVINGTIEVIYKIKSQCPNSFTFSTYIPGFPDSLQGFTTLEHNTGYIIKSKHSEDLLNTPQVLHNQPSPTLGVSQTGGLLGRRELECRHNSPNDHFISDFRGTRIDLINNLGTYHDGIINEVYRIDTDPATGQPSIKSFFNDPLVPSFAQTLKTLDAAKGYLFKINSFDATNNDRYINRYDLYATTATGDEEDFSITIGTSTPNEVFELLTEFYHDEMFFINWGDGGIEIVENPMPNSNTYEYKSYSHTYEQPGQYTIVISHDVNFSVRFRRHFDRNLKMHVNKQLRKINGWGSNCTWHNVQGCIYLTSIPSLGDYFSNKREPKIYQNKWAGFFADCLNFNDPNIVRYAQKTNMGMMLWNCRSFNQQLDMASIMIKQSSSQGLGGSAVPVGMTNQIAFHDNNCGHMPLEQDYTSDLYRYLASYNEVPDYSLSPENSLRCNYQGLSRVSNWAHFHQNPLSFHREHANWLGVNAKNYSLLSDQHSSAPITTNDDMSKAFLSRDTNLNYTSTRTLIDKDIDSEIVNDVQFFNIDKNRAASPGQMGPVYRYKDIGEVYDRSSTAKLEVMTGMHDIDNERSHAQSSTGSYSVVLARGEDAATNSINVAEYEIDILVHGGATPRNDNTHIGYDHMPHFRSRQALLNSFQPPEDVKVFDPLVVNHWKEHPELAIYVFNDDPEGEYVFLTWDYRIHPDQYFPYEEMFVSTDIPTDHANMYRYEFWYTRHFHDPANDARYKTVSDEPYEFHLHRDTKNLNSSLGKEVSMGPPTAPQYIASINSIARLEAGFKHPYQFSHEIMGIHIYSPIPVHPFAPTSYWAIGTASSYHPFQWVGGSSADLEATTVFADRYIYSSVGQDRRALGDLHKNIAGWDVGPIVNNNLYDSQTLLNQGAVLLDQDFTSDYRAFPSENLLYGRQTNPYFYDLNVYDQSEKEERNNHKIDPTTGGNSGSKKPVMSGRPLAYKKKFHKDSCVLWRRYLNILYDVLVQIEIHNGGSNGKAQGRDKQYIDQMIGADGTSTEHETTPGTPLINYYGHPQETSFRRKIRAALDLYKANNPLFQAHFDGDFATPNDQAYPLSNLPSLWYDPTDVDNDRKTNYDARHSVDYAALHVDPNNSELTRRRTGKRCLIAANGGKNRLTRNNHYGVMCPYFTGHSWLFGKCVNLNSDPRRMLDTAQITDGMFYKCETFNQPVVKASPPINGLNQYGLIRFPISFKYMFDGCKAFNQDLSNLLMCPSLTSDMNGGIISIRSNNTDFASQYSKGDAEIQFPSVFGSIYSRGVDNRLWGRTDSEALNTLEYNGTAIESSNSNALTFGKAIDNQHSEIDNIYACQNVKSFGMQWSASAFQGAAYGQYGYGRNGSYSKSVRKKPWMYSLFGSKVYAKTSSSGSPGDIGVDRETIDHETIENAYTSLMEDYYYGDNLVGYKDYKTQGFTLDGGPDNSPLLSQTTNGGLGATTFIGSDKCKVGSTIETIEPNYFRKSGSYNLDYGIYETPNPMLNSVYFGKEKCIHPALIQAGGSDLPRNRLRENAYVVPDWNVSDSDMQYIGHSIFGHFSYENNLNILSGPVGQSNGHIHTNLLAGNVAGKNIQRYRKIGGGQTSRISLIESLRNGGVRPYGYPEYNVPVSWAVPYVHPWPRAGTLSKFLDRNQGLGNSLVDWSTNVYRPFRGPIHNKGARNDWSITMPDTGAQAFGSRVSAYHHSVGFNSSYYPPLNSTAISSPATSMLAMNDYERIHNSELGRQVINENDTSVREAVDTGSVDPSSRLLNWADFDATYAKINMDLLGTDTGEDYSHPYEKTLREIDTGSKPIDFLPWKYFGHYFGWHTQSPNSIYNDLDFATDNLAGKKVLENYGIHSFPTTTVFGELVNWATCFKGPEQLPFGAEFLQTAPRTAGHKHHALLSRTYWASYTPRGRVVEKMNPVWDYQDNIMRYRHTRFSGNFNHNSINFPFRNTYAQTRTVNWSTTFFRSTLFDPTAFGRGEEDGAKFARLAGTAAIRNDAYRFRGCPRVTSSNFRTAGNLVLFNPTTAGFHLGNHLGYINRTPNWKGCSHNEFTYNSVLYHRLDGGRNMKFRTFKDHAYTETVGNRGQVSYAPLCGIRFLTGTNFSSQNYSLLLAALVANSKENKPLQDENACTIKAAPVFEVVNGERILYNLPPLIDVGDAVVSSNITDLLNKRSLENNHGLVFIDGSRDWVGTRAEMSQKYNLAMDNYYTVGPHTEWEKSLNSCVKVAPYSLAFSALTNRVGARKFYTDTLGSEWFRTSNSSPSNPYKIHTEEEISRTSQYYCEGFIAPENHELYGDILGQFYDSSRRNMQSHSWKAKFADESTVTHNSPLSSTVASTPVITRVYENFDIPTIPSGQTTPPPLSANSNTTEFVITMIPVSGDGSLITPSSHSGIFNGAVGTFESHYFQGENLCLYSSTYYTKKHDYRLGLKISKVNLPGYPSRVPIVIDFGHDRNNSKQFSSSHTCEEFNYDLVGRTSLKANTSLTLTDQDPVQFIEHRYSPNVNEDLSLNFDNTSSDSWAASGVATVKVFSNYPIRIEAVKIHDELTERTASNYRDFNDRFIGNSGLSEYYSRWKEPSVSGIVNWGNAVNMDIFSSRSNLNKYLYTVPSSLPVNFNTFFNYNSGINPTLNDLFSNTDIFNSASVTGWNLSGVAQLTNTFHNAKKFNQDISNWDVSYVTNMSDMFKGALDFNQNIDSWTTSGVVDMQGMFSDAKSFNQSLNSWDTSSVKYMSRMFECPSHTGVFNGNISSWDMSGVLDTSYMFNGADAFNQPVSGWNTVTIRNMDYMFNNATAFDQDIYPWNMSGCVSAVNFMSNYDSSKYDAVLNAWDTTSNNKGFIDVDASQSGGAFNIGFGSTVSTASSLDANLSFREVRGWDIKDGGIS